MSSKKLWIGIALVAAGCDQAADGAPAPGWKVGSEQPEQTTEPTEQPTEVVRPQQAADEALYACTPEGSSELVSYWVDVRPPRFTPNEGLFVATNTYQPSNAIVSTDGQEVTALPAIDMYGVDDAWQTGIYATPYGTAEVRDVATGEVHAEFEGVVTAAMSGDGSTAAIVLCDEHISAQLVLFDLETEVSQRVTLSEDACYTFGYSQQQNLLFTPDACVLTGTVIPGQIFAYDRGSENLRVKTIAVPAEEWATAQVAGAALDPRTEQLVTVVEDGTMQRWALPGLEPVGDATSVGAFAINQYTYAPQFVVSPVAFRADGGAMAFVNEAGDVVVRNAAGDYVLPTPEKPAEIEDWDERVNVPVRIAFSPSGTRIGVTYQFGSTVWGCGAEDVPQSPGFALETPDEILVSRDQGTSVEIPFELRGNELAALRVERLDGTDLGVTMTRDLVNLWLPERADLDVRIRATDGTSTATQVVRVRFE